jgi:hypothetical protein
MSILFLGLFLPISPLPNPDQQDPDRSGAARIAQPAAPPAASRGTGVVVDHSGPDTFNTADFHGIDNGSNKSVAWVSLDLSADADAFWDFDGGTTFGNATTPVIGATNYGGTVSYNFPGPNGPLLILSFTPALASGEFVRFGADTDFFVSDPCPGGAFANAPCVTIVGFSDGSSCTIPYALISSSVSEGSCGVSGPTLRIAGSCPGPVTLDVSGATPGGGVAILYGNAGVFIKNGPPCAGLMLGIANPTLGGVVNANASGNAALSFNAPPAACGRTVQAVDIASCVATNPAVL